jgi:hypothetical protein
MRSRFRHAGVGPTVAERRDDTVAEEQPEFTAEQGIGTIPD